MYDASTASVSEEIGVSEEREAEPGRERPTDRRGPPGTAVGRDARLGTGCDAGRRHRRP